jgi:hypothetical protein
MTMNPQVLGYIVNEGAHSAVFSEPKILFANDNIVRFEANLQKGGNEINRNNRNYPTALLLDGLNHDFVKERIRTRSWYCEAGHPNTKDLQRQMSIDHANIACLINSWSQEGDQFKGIIETAATTVGKDMRGLIVDNKSTVAFSMRGLVGFQKNSKGFIDAVAPIRIFCYDWVQHPSHPGSYADSRLTGAMESTAVQFTGNMDEYVSQLVREEVQGILSNDSNVKESAQGLGVESFLDGSIKLASKFNAIDVENRVGVKARLFLESSTQRDLDNFLSNL